MYYLHILKATLKVNLSVAFFLWSGEKKSYKWNSLFNFVPIHLQSFIYGLLSIQPMCLNYFQLNLSQKYFHKFSKASFIWYGTVDVLWFFSFGNCWVHTFDFEREPWKKVSFNKYLKEAWRKILSIIYSMCLNL